MSKYRYAIQNETLCGAVLATVLFVSLPAYADKTRITAKTDVKPLVTLSAQESQAMSLAAGRILLHVDNARVAIGVEDNKKAQKELDQGLTLIKVIENAQPKYKVTTTIKTGDVTYSDADEVSSRFVPVYNEQHIENVIAPVAQAKAKKSKGHGHKSAFLEDYSAWRQSTMKLNVVMAADALALAKKELDKGHFDNADMALSLLQSEGVVFEFYEVELPLTEAADDLKLAQLEVSEGKVEQAKATLKRTSDNLKKYGSIVGESRAKEVSKLRKEVDKLASTLTLKKGNHSSNTLDKAEEKIESYWERAVRWFK